MFMNTHYSQLQCGSLLTMNENILFMLWGAFNGCNLSPVLVVLLRSELGDCLI